jgi:hypothetical protein
MEHAGHTRRGRSALAGEPSARNRTGHLAWKNSVELRASGRIRTRDPLLRRSFHAWGQPAVSLVRASLLIAWLRLNVSGFRPVLARGWHGARLGHAARTALVGELASASPSSNRSPEVLYAGQNQNIVHFRPPEGGRVAALSFCTAHTLRHVPPRGLVVPTHSSELALVASGSCPPTVIRKWLTPQSSVELCAKLVTHPR